MELLELALGFAIGLLVGGVTVALLLKASARRREAGYANQLQELRQALDKSRHDLKVVTDARAAERRQRQSEEAAREEPEEPGPEAPAVAAAPDGAEDHAEDHGELVGELEVARAELEERQAEALALEQEVQELRLEAERLAADLAESKRAYEVRDQDVEALLAANERWKQEVVELRDALETARSETTLEAIAGPNGEGGGGGSSEELSQAMAALAESEERARQMGEALTACETRVAELTSRLEEAENRPPPAAPPSTDDLTRIRGIGAVFARRLIGIGITTCRELADSDPAAIREQLDLVDVGRVKIEDWVEDAKDLVLDDEGMEGGAPVPPRANPSA